MSEWIRHRGSKSMPKRLEGKRFEVRHRIGSTAVGNAKDDRWEWKHLGFDWDILAYRILGDINPPDYSKGFPVGTTAKDIGAKLWDRFVVVDSSGGFKNGEVIELIEDDGDEVPYFRNHVGDEHYMNWKELAPIPPKTAIELQAEEVGIPEQEWPEDRIDNIGRNGGDGIHYDETHLGIKRPDGNGWVKYNAGDVVDLDGVVSIGWVNVQGTTHTAKAPRELEWDDGGSRQIAWYRLNYGSEQITLRDIAPALAEIGATIKLEDAKPNKYQRTIKGVTVDVYDVLAAFGVTCQARGHAIKKLLMAGQRGHKDEAQDLREAVQAIERSVQLIKGD